MVFGFRFSVFEPFEKVFTLRIFSLRPLRLCGEFYLFFTAETQRTQRKRREKLESTMHFAKASVFGKEIFSPRP
jgi:hypothetical protein